MKNGLKTLLILMLLYLTAFNAFAADIYPCVDTDNNGIIDTLCPAPDQNFNGIASDGTGGFPGTDGLDSEPLAYTLEWTHTGCGVAGQYHRMLANGTFSSCVDPTVSVQCEAPGGSTCKYINPATGSDTTGNGSYTNPWQTWKMVGYYLNAGSRPAGWYSLQSGDWVYQIGGTAGTTYDNGENPAGTIAPITVVTIDADGADATHRVTLAAYPGTHPIIDTNNAANCVQTRLTSSFVDMHGFELNECATNPLIVAGADHDIYGNIIHDSNALGNGPPNNSGVKFNSPLRVKFHQNRVYDLYDSVAGINENVALLVVFDGDDLEVTDNYFYYTCDPTAGSCTKQGNGPKYKHGVNDPATYKFARNKVWHINGNAIQSGTANSDIRNNLVYDSTGACLYVADIGGGFYPKGLNFISNSCIRAGGLHYVPSQVTSQANIGLATIQKNVIIHAATVWNSESNLLRLDCYGGAATYATVVTGNLLDIDNNCYWRNNGTAITTTPFFTCLYGYGNHPPGDWFSYAGHTGISAIGDTHSSFINPALDAQGRAAAAGCQDKGAVPYSAVTPTPTITPTPTPSPTPTPGGAVSGAKFLMRFK